jgi:transposase-like protein
MNLVDVMRELGTEEQCFAFLEQQRWPDGVQCPACGCERISRIERRSESKNVRKNRYQCLGAGCRQQFSVTSGTIFHDSRIPLAKWFLAVSLVMDAKKGISAKQLQRHLGLKSYQTAWHMVHRIREAMIEGERPKLDGVVAIDEAYLGGHRHGQENVGRSMLHKEVVLGMRQKGGDLRFFHAQDAKSGTLAKFIGENISRDVDTVMTDEWPAYPKAMIEAGIHGTKHKRINHSKGVYVDAGVTTNGVESAFSLFKRGIVGNFHQVSAKHLHRYLTEFEYRFNRRTAKDGFTQAVARIAQTAPLTYRELVYEPEIPF